MTGSFFERPILGGQERRLSANDRGLEVDDEVFKEVPRGARELRRLPRATRPGAVVIAA
jgi:hypothetical protein